MTRAWPALALAAALMLTAGPATSQPMSRADFPIKGMDGTTVANHRLDPADRARVEALTAVAVADIDGDGVVDLVTGSAYAPGLSVHRGSCP